MAIKKEHVVTVKRMLTTVARWNRYSGAKPLGE